jgi:hypothetical protein
MASEGRARDEEALVKRWVVYNKRLLFLRRQAFFHIVNFDVDVLPYLGQLESAATSLGLKFDRGVVMDFVSDALRHERDSRPVPAEAAGVYEELLAFSETGQTPTDVIADAGATFGDAIHPGGVPSPEIIGERWSERCLALAHAMCEIQRLHEGLEETVRVRDAEIRRLQGDARGSRT